MPIDSEVELTTGYDDVNSECSICLDRLENACLFPCGHSFCGPPKNCLVSLLAVDQPGKWPKCPVCRADVTFPGVAESATQEETNSDDLPEALQRSRAATDLDVCMKHREPKNFFCKQEKILFCQFCWIENHCDLEAHHVIPYLAIKKQKLQALVPKLEEYHTLFRPLVASLDKMNKISNDFTFTDLENLEKISNEGTTSDFEASLKIIETSSLKQLELLGQLRQLFSNACDLVQTAEQKLTQVIENIPNEHLKQTPNGEDFVNENGADQRHTTGACSSEQASSQPCASKVLSNKPKGSFKKGRKLMFKSIGAAPLDLHFDTDRYITHCVFDSDKTVFCRLELPSEHIRRPKQLMASIVVLKIDRGNLNLDKVYQWGPLTQFSNNEALFDIAFCNKNLYGLLYHGRQYSIACLNPANLHITRRVQIGDAKINCSMLLALTGKGQHLVLLQRETGAWRTIFLFTNELFEAKIDLAHNSTTQWNFYMIKNYLFLRGEQNSFIRVNLTDKSVDKFSLANMQIEDPSFLVSERFENKSLLFVRGGAADSKLLVYQIDMAQNIDGKILELFDVIDWKQNATYSHSLLTMLTGTTFLSAHRLKESRVTEISMYHFRYADAQNN